MRPKWNTEHIESFIDEMEEKPPFWRSALAGLVYIGAFAFMLFSESGEIPVVGAVLAFIIGTSVGEFDARKKFVEKLEDDCVEI